MISKNKKIVVDIMSLYMVHAANFLVPIILIPHLTKVFGPIGWGEISLLLGVSQYLTLVVEYAFHLSAQREVAIVKDNYEQVNKLIERVISAKLILALIMLPILIWVAFKFNFSLNLLFLAYFCCLVQAMSFSWFFRGTSKIFLSSAVDLFAKTVSAITIFSFVNDASDVGIYFLLILLAGLFSVLYSYYLITRDYKIHLNFKGGLSEIKNSFGTFKLHGLGTALALSPIVNLGFVSGAYEVGIYSAADRVARAVASLLDPVRHFMYPRISSIITKDKKKAGKEIFLTLLLMGLGGLFFSVVTYLFSGVLIRFLFGEKFSAAVPILQLLSLLPFLISIGNVAVVLWLLPNKRENTIFGILIIAFFLLNTSSLIFIGDFGSFGMACSVLFSESVLIGFSFFWGYRVYRAGLSLQVTK